MNRKFHINSHGAAGTASKARTVLSLLVLTAFIITLISVLTLGAAAETSDVADGSVTSDMPNGGVPGDNSDNPGIITDPAGSATSAMPSTGSASDTTPGTATDTASAMDEGGSIVGIIIAIVVVIAVIIIVIALIPKKK